jgi:hypothetical protein
MEILSHWLGSSSQAQDKAMRAGGPSTYLDVLSDSGCDHIAATRVSNALFDLELS